MSWSFDYTQRGEENVRDEHLELKFETLPITKLLTLA